MTYRAATAMHEAGHCVVAVHEGLTLAWAVCRENGTGAYEYPENPLDIVDIDRLVLPRDRLLTERVVRVKLAGNVAQFRAYPGSTPSDGHDLRSCRGLLAPFTEIDQQYDPSADVETYIDVLRREVRALLAHESVWREVEAVAEQLLATGRLDGEEITHISESAHWGVPVPFTVIDSNGSDAHLKENTNAALSKR